MRCFFNYVTIEPQKGVMVGYAVKEALELSKTLDREVRFKFNGIPVVANPTDQVNDILDRWWSAKENNGQAHLTTRSSR